MLKNSSTLLTAESSTMKPSVLSHVLGARETVVLGAALSINHTTTVNSKAGTTQATNQHHHHDHKYTHQHAFTHQQPC